MAVVDSVMWTVHVLFAGVWTGSVVFAVYAILPSALEGTIDPDPLQVIVSRLQWITRISALLLLISGGHLAGTLYTVETLTGTVGGYLVLAMLVLWLVLTGLIEVGSKKLASGLANRKLREPARAARPFYYGAAVVAILLLINAGLLAAGVR